jgi:Kef-type K+ transport system membrane component KefB
MDLGILLVTFGLLLVAGMALDALGSAGSLAVAFIVLRVVGRVAGGWLGGRLGGLPSREAWSMGFALTPQAGVALGMALVAAEAAPDLAETIVVTTIATTIFFELFGPLLTRFVLRRVNGEGKSGGDSAA